MATIAHSLPHAIMIGTMPNGENLDPWRRLRLHRRVLFGGWLGWLPWAALASGLSNVFHTESVFPLLLVPYGIAWLINGAVLAAFRCPRCENSFGHRGTYGNAFTLRCLHCGQRAYEAIDPAPVETIPFRLW